MSAELEKSIIGAAITAPQTIPTILNTITPEDFHHPQHQSILQAVIDLWTDGNPVDVLSVNSALEKRGVQVGGVPYIYSCTEIAALPQSLPFHLEDVRDTAAKRRLATAGQRITQLANADFATPDAIEQAQTLLDGVVRTDSGTVLAVADTMPDTLEEIRATQRGEIQQGIPTGFTQLDELTNGLAGGQMIIVAARPGVGKSTLAVDFMREISIRQNLPTLMFSLEMGQEDVNKRLLAAESSVSLGKITKGNLTIQDEIDIANAAERITASPMYFDYTTGATIVDIVAKTKLYVAKYGVRMMVVDYIQLIESSGYVENRQQEVAKYSRQLKLLAKACNIPVIAIAQLNRGPEQRGEDARPMPSDLKESGALEQDADVIMLIQRPDSKNPDHERAGEADVIVAKNRRGRTGDVTVAAQLHYSRFSNMG